MLCENCGENEANVKYTEINNGVKKQMMLCEECSKKLGIDKNYFDFNMPINLSSFLGEFLQAGENNLLEEIMPESSKTCDKCHMTYDEFMQTGKLGCDHCYETFFNKIDPVLKKIHGANRYVGRKLQISDNTKRDSFNKTTNKMEEKPKTDKK